MDNPVVLIFIMAGVALVAALLLIGGGLALRKSQQEERIVEAKRELLEPPAPAPDSSEILRVERDPISGQMAVRILGGRAASPGDLTPAQADQLKRVLVELSKWIMKPAGAAAPAGGAPLREMSPSPAAAPVSFESTLPQAPGALDHMPFLRRKPAAKLPPTPAAPRSIVEQIDEIVQAKLAGTPLAARGIKLEELPGAGLGIVNGAKTYNGINEIDDPEVKAIIRSAVQEWNEKNRLNPNPPRG
jgi:hypothetical protein